MAQVTMYSTTWCGYCRRLKLQLDQAGIAYDEVDIERDPEAAAYVESVNGGNQTVPTVRFADGTALTNPPFAVVAEKVADLAAERGTPPGHRAHVLACARWACAVHGQVGRRRCPRRRAAIGAKLVKSGHVQRTTDRSSARSASSRSFSS